MKSSRFVTSHRPQPGSVARVPQCPGEMAHPSFGGVEQCALPARLGGLDRDEDCMHPGEGSA